MKRNLWWVLFVPLALLCYPPQWYPQSIKRLQTSLFGAPADRPLPASMPASAIHEMHMATEPPEVFCPPDPEGWRDAHEIEGVLIEASETCVADNPWLVTASVKGTNNVSAETLMRSGLTADAVELGRDLDGDGDPDEIHIRLEVAELNGGSPIADTPVTRYAIAPGVEPGLWVFVPKLTGMAVENFESQQARPEIRLPSPAIRIEQGDVVQITLENGHYMPHTIHLHGADHPFVDVTGEGNDGVPIASEIPVLPGSARTYELSPRHSGTMFYHCHVHAHVHMQMGLQGLFIIEENRPDNWLQTLNLGAGQVRVRSVSSRETHDAEYDLHYLDLDRQLVERIRLSNDPRIITRSMHNEYDVTDATQDYFTINGRSFPYAFRESLVIGDEGDHIKLRVVALHTHGHKFTVTHKDGVEVPLTARAPEDVRWIATAERVDLDLDLVNDGLHAYGPGIWMFHDHQAQGMTTDGIAPGGNKSAIVYREYLNENGWPKLQGMSWDAFFTAAYYRKEIPVWSSYLPGLLDNAGEDRWLLWRLLGLALALGVLIMWLLVAIVDWLRR
jgi:FtsP/CotA-like multicopper oxidase with cupredoxin domain